MIFTYVLKIEERAQCKSEGKEKHLQHIGLEQFNKQMKKLTLASSLHNEYKLI